MCNCIERFNEALVPHNARLDIPLEINWETGEFLPPRVQIMICKVEKSRKRLPALMARFCPFCGVRYEEKNG